MIIKKNVKFESKMTATFNAAVIRNFTDYLL